MADSDEIMTEILDELKSQNKILPALIFKVDILWKVLCIVSGATLLGFLGWVGSLILKGAS